MCVGLCISHIYVILNLWVCTTASLEEKYSMEAVAASILCVGLCVSRLRNLASWAVYNSLAARKVQRRLHQYTYVGVHNSLAGRNV